MDKKVEILALLLLLAVGVRAQVDADTSRWHLSLSTGTMFTSGFGESRSLQWLSPTITLKPTDRLTVVSGFAVAGQFLPHGFRVTAYEPDLAPRRHGTEATALWAGARYQVSDRLALWGVVSHAGGYVQPLWLDHSMPLQAPALSGGLQYELSDDSFLELHFRVVHDNYGSAMHSWLGHPWYGPLCPDWEVYSGQWPW